MSALLASRSRWVVVLLSSLGLLHCGGGSDDDRPSASAGSGVADGNTAGEGSSTGGRGGSTATTAGGVGDAPGEDATAAGSPSGVAGATVQGEPSIPTINGCDASDYVDLSDDEAERTILIAAEGLTFSPKCMLVAANQTVTWQGSLSAHPLAPGNPADATAGSADNPIPNANSGSSVDVTFDTAGSYPYYCQLHSFGMGQGMAGVVYVRQP